MPAPKGGGMWLNHPNTRSQLVETGATIKFSSMPRILSKSSMLLLTIHKSLLPQGVNLVPFIITSYILD